MKYLYKIFYTVLGPTQRYERGNSFIHKTNLELDDSQQIYHIARKVISEKHGVNQLAITIKKVSKQYEQTEKKEGN